MTNFKKISLSAALVVAAAWQAPALADGPKASPLVAVGAGTESTVDHSGTNLLLRLEAGVGTGGNLCKFGDAVCLFRTSQLVWMHVDGEASLKPGEDGLKKLHYMNVKFTPIAVPVNVQQTQKIEEWIGRYGVDTSVQIVGLPTEIRRDRNFQQDLSVRADLIGIDAAIQAFPTEILGVYVQGAVDALGARIMKSAAAEAAATANNSGAPNGLKPSIGVAHVEAGIVMAFSEAFVLRATGGAEYASTYDTQQDKVLHDLDIFGRLSASVTRLFDVNAQVTRGIEDYGNGQKFQDTRFTTNLRFKLDF